MREITAIEPRQSERNSGNIAIIFIQNKVRTLCRAHQEIFWLPVPYLTPTVLFISDICWNMSRLISGFVFNACAGITFTLSVPMMPTAHLSCSKRSNWVLHPKKWLRLFPKSIKPISLVSKSALITITLLTAMKIVTSLNWSIRSWKRMGSLRARLFLNCMIRKRICSCRIAL